MKTKFCAYAGLTAVISYVIAKFTVFPIFPSAPFLKMHFGEVPLLLVMLCGPWQLGICSLFIKEILSFFISGNNIFSLLADFISVGTFLLTTKFILKKAESNFFSILIASAIGSIVRMLAAIPVNIVVLHVLYGSSFEAVMLQMVYILPFNLIKAMLSGICAALVYVRAKKPLSAILNA